MIDHEWIDKLCELPLAIAACPTAAIKPAKTESGLKTLEVKNERCMFCGNCYTMCAAMPLADEDGSGVALLVGGKAVQQDEQNRNSPKSLCRLSPISHRDGMTRSRLSRGLLTCMPRMHGNMNDWAIGRSVLVGKDSSRNVTCLSATT